MIEPGGGANPPTTLVREAISGLTRAFMNDGYDLRVVACDSKCLRLAIDARPGACPDCLVPRDMMEGLVRAQLPAWLNALRIEIDYPKGSLAH